MDQSMDRGEARVPRVRARTVTAVPVTAVKRAASIANWVPWCYVYVNVYVTLLGQELVDVTLTRLARRYPYNRLAVHLEPQCVGQLKLVSRNFVAVALLIDRYLRPLNTETC
eukprot:553489-Prorocentrum_minimum.AAC.4